MHIGDGSKARQRAARVVMGRIWREYMRRDCCPPTREISREDFCGPAMGAGLHEWRREDGHRLGTIRVIAVKFHGKKFEFRGKVGCWPQFCTRPWECWEITE